MAKIVQVCNTNFYLNRFLKPLVLELAQQGHEVTCITSTGSVDPEFESSGVKVLAFDYPQSANPLKFLTSIFAMKKILSQGKYDMVNSHNRNASIVARVASFLAGVPLNVYTAHGMYFHDDQGPLGHKITEWIEGLLSKITGHTLSQSQEDVDFMIRRGWLSKDQISYIGNGIDTVKFDPKLKKPSSKEAFNIMALGRLVRGKGFEDLIEAFAHFNQEVPQSRLTIIGGTIAKDIEPAAQQLVNRIDQLGIKDKVKITGIVSNVQDYLSEGDIFIHPSYREGVPRSLLEAMSMGLLPMATSIRGAREIIIEGENGFLFPPKSPEGLLGTLKKVYSLSSTQRQNVSQSASRLVQDVYNEKAYVNRQTTILNGLLKNQMADLKKEAS